MVWKAQSGLRHSLKKFSEVYIFARQNYKKYYLV